MTDKNYYLGKKIPVNSQGWIMLCDVMGSDHDIANAARTSYGKNEKDTSKDEHLIRYLMRHGHTSPFEMAELKFMVYVPMDIWRQWVRHRTASINEYSTRYSIAIDQMYETPQWRLQSQTNKQGSDGLLSDADSVILSEQEEKFHKAARDLYQKRIKMGVAREQARKDLPLSTFTQAYWKIDLHNLLHFLYLRTDSSAQKEIRDYACTIALVVSELFPLTWRAFSDYQMCAVSFSVPEQRAFALGLAVIIEKLSGVSDAEIKKKYGKYENDLPDDWKKDKCRERDEFFDKVKRLIQFDEATVGIMTELVK